MTDQHTRPLYSRHGFEAIRRVDYENYWRRQLACRERTRHRKRLYALVTATLAPWQAEIVERLRREFA